MRLGLAHEATTDQSNAFFVHIFRAHDSSLKTDKIPSMLSHVRSITLIAGQI